MTSHRHAGAMAAVLALLYAASAEARRLDLPVRDAAHREVAAPAYRGDAFILRQRAPLTPTQSRAGRLARLEITAVDAAARSLGAWFEPEFKGERGDDAQSAAFASYVRVHVPAGTDLGAALDRFAGVADVESAEPIPIMPVSSLPNDSLWAQSSWFYQSSRHDLHAPECWDVTTGDSALVVAIIDTGVLRDHPELGGRTPGSNGQMWTNWDEAGGQPGVDDDGNGFVDDTWGWDFVDLIPGSDVRAGEDGYDPDGDPNDFVGHGTNVAGLIGAIANNGSGIAGTIWKVRLMALRIGWASDRSPTGEVGLDYAAQAVRYATRMGANVINCSFSTQPFGPLFLAVADATRNGVIVVAAAGNNGSPNALGDREDVLSVSALDRNDVIAPFSNLAPSVDVAAPGDDIATTSILRPGTDSLGVRQPGYTLGASGTSFAAAFASGAAALVQSRRIALAQRPLTPLEMILHLRETADPIDDVNPGRTGFGTGRIDLARAVSQAPASRITRGAALTVGPGVTLVDDAGRTRVAWVTTDARLLVLEGASGDTMLDVALPAAPAGGIAAATMGGGVGTALFVGLVNGHVAGMYASGEPLPGWPVGLGPATQSFTSVALGDLDGDGVLEVVAVGSIHGVCAWHVDGTPVAGFPRFGNEHVTGSVALSDLDGQPGAEIVFSTLDGFAHVLRGDARELPGWPADVGRFIPASSPVITRFGADPQPTIVIADGNLLHAFRPDASARFEAPLWNYDVADPGLADLDGDGSDDIVVLSGPFLAPFNGSGGMLPGRWPIDDVMPSTGDPIVGWCGGPTPGIVYRGARSLLGRDATGAMLHGFPKPGFAGLAPLLGQLDGDDATELVAGTGPDSLIYMYDLGAGSWRTTPQGWPTARGNFARTGSHVYAPGVATIDGTAPAAIADLRIGAVGPGHVALSWTAPSDQPAGTAAVAYELRTSESIDGVTDFVHAMPIVPLPIPGAPGTVEHAEASGLIEGQTYWFAIRSRDANGNRSAISNLVTAAMPRVAPAVVSDLTLESAGDSAVVLRWTATGDDGAIGRPKTYHLRAATAAIDGANFDRAPYAVDVPATVDAGGDERATFTRLPAGRRLWFALEAEDPAGTLSPLSNVTSGFTDIGGPLAGRVGAALVSGVQPARAPVAMWWQISPSGERAPHRIEVFDLRGRKVRTLDAGPGVGGVTPWDGHDDDGHRVSPGIYFARLTAAGEQAGARIVLLP
jgi:hypothetical protein